MCHICSTAAHSTSLDVSDFGCLLHILVHCSVIHICSRYELDVVDNVQLIN